MQPFRKHLRWWLGRASQQLLSRPNLFRGFKLCILLMLCRLSTAFKWMAGRAPPNTVQLKSRCWVNFLSGWREAFLKHSKLRLGRVPPNTAQFLQRCWRKFYSSGCYAAISKPFKLMAGPRSPISPVTAQLISRRRSFFLFWSCTDFQQRSNERLVVLPQTRSSSIHGVESTFRPDGIKLFKNIQTLAGSCFIKHGPILFTVLPNLFDWMLCSHLKTFKLMAGPRSPTSPVTAQLISRR